MLGDHASPSLAKEDLAVIESLKASGVPVVVIVISGRPLLLGKVASEAEAIVAAWLPGTEGIGITDVLFGDHPAKGRLSFAWPRDDGALLFPFGHGLDGRERSDSGEKQSP
jgi:beta-glucosidase